MLNGNMSEAEGKIGINTIDHLDPEKQSGANTFLTLAENVANASNFVQRPEQATKTKRKYNTGGRKTDADRAKRRFDRESRITSWPRVRQTGSSIVWNTGAGFSKYTDNRKVDVVICEQCVLNGSFEHAEVMYGSSRSTSHIMQHCKTHHRKFWEEMVHIPPGPKTSRSSIKSASSMKITSNSMALLCKFMVQNYLSISSLASKSFANLFTVYNHHAELPNIARLKELLHQRKCLLELNIRKIVEGQVEAVSVERWTNDSNETFYSFVRHHISSDWESIALSLECLRYDSRLPVPEFLDIFNEIQTRHSIRPVDVVTPADLSCSTTMPFPRTDCFAFRLGTVLESFFSDPGVAQTLLSARKLSNFLHSNTELCSALKDMCHIPDIDIADIDHIWWSTYTMLSVLYPLRIPLETLGTVLIHDIISPECWTMIEFCSQLLEPFVVIQKSLGKEQFITNSLCIPFIHDLRNSLKDLCEGDKLVPNIALNMLNVVNSLWESSGTVFHYREGKSGFTKEQILATALDPRTFDLYGVPESERSDVKELLIMELSRFTQIGEEQRLAQHASKVLFSQPSESAFEQIGTLADNTIISDNFGKAMFTQNAKRRLSGFLERSAEAGAKLMEENNTESILWSVATARFDELAVNEVERFSKLSILPMENPVTGQPNNPLNWWVEHQLEFPHLGRFARCILCIPAVSAPVDQFFSTNGVNLVQRRKCLTEFDDGASLQVFLRNSWDSVDAWNRRH